MTIFDLSCNGEEFPLHVTDELCLRWKLADCVRQTGYRVRIFGGETELLSVGRRSAEQVCRIRRPQGLQPLTCYRWTVEVDTDTGTGFAEGKFQTSLLSGWGEAQWISDGRRFVEDSGVVGSPALYLRKKFTLAKLPEAATVHVCGLGFYELFLNGRRVGDRVLEPAFTAYDKRFLFSVYRVEELLQLGENRIEAVLGDGWYNQTTRDTWGFFRAAWRDYPKLLFRLDAGALCVASDRSWEQRTGIVASSAVRAGEIQDFRLADAEKWRPVCLVAGPGGVGVPQRLPPVRECETLEPVSVTETHEPVCVAETLEPTSVTETGKAMLVDFGKNISGYCRFRASGPAGARVTLVYSDRLTDGVPDNVSNGMYLSGTGLRFQTDELILDGNRDDFRPRFVYHGFRYVRIECSDRSVELGELRACFVHTDLKRIGSFSCSDPLLNTLHEMSMNAILGNFHGFPTDCPHREKNGWTGDAQLSMEACLYHFDMSSAYPKWIDDITDAQRPSGQIPAIVPTCGWGYNWGSGPAWDAALFLLTEAVWDWYGDESTARRAYPALKAAHAYLSGYLKNGLLSVGLGDWNYPKRIKFAVCPTELTDSCYFLKMTQILERMSGSFEPSEGPKYARLADSVTFAVREKYAGRERSLTGLACLSFFGISNESAAIVRYLEQHGFEPHCGILGMKFLLAVLGRSGRTDLACRMLTRTEYPSFGYWVKEGQTSLCEDFELTNSLNHHMYSTVSEFLVRYVLGVSFRDHMRRAELRPCLPDSLEFAESEFDTPCGRLSFRVDHEGMRLVVPPNASAVLSIGGRVKRMGTGVYEFDANGRIRTEKRAKNTVPEESK